jgi:L-methionine (R)-S-oxide reductase
VSSIIWHAFVEAERPINWAGFYFVRPLANPKESDHDRILILGPFMGKPACSRIRFQSGVCGAAWRTKSMQRIADVHEFPGHIACDDASESELVVPVFDKQGEVIALIDLDCPEKNGFSVADERTFVEVARVMSAACDWGNVGLPYTQP